MSEIQFILNDNFWKFLVSLEGLKEKKEKNLFCESLGINEETLFKFQEFLNRFNVMSLNIDGFVMPLKEQCKIKMEFSFSEWLALQASFHKEEDKNNLEHYYQHIVQNKLLVAQNACVQFNLFNQTSGTTVCINKVEDLKKKFDYVISHKKPITIEFHNSKECIVFPHRLVFLDGILCVIGESTHDKMLVYFGVEDIKDIKDFNQTYEPNLSQIEINEFVCHLRLVNGKEERLVLKIYNQYESDLLPSHHFLGSPFVTTNAEGDMIWAATLEICEDLFQWLYEMKDRAEVLDPRHIRKEFALYCENKKEKSGDKKAS